MQIKYSNILYLFDFQIYHHNYYMILFGASMEMNEMQKFYIFYAWFRKLLNWI